MDGGPQDFCHDLCKVEKIKYKNNFFGKGKRSLIEDTCISIAIVCRQSPKADCSSRTIFLKKLHQRGCLIYTYIYIY